MNDILGDGWMDDSSHTGDILRSTFVAYQIGEERGNIRMRWQIFTTLLFIQCMLNVDTNKILSS
jgi:hypothetical protein